MLFRGLAIIRRNGVLLEIYTYTQCCFGVNAKLNFCVAEAGIVVGAKS